MSFTDEESSVLQHTTQPKMESFLFSKNSFNQFQMLLWHTNVAHTWIFECCDVSCYAAVYKFHGFILIPACELSSKVPFYTFQGDEEEDLEHFLELRTVCSVFTVIFYAHVTSVEVFGLDVATLQTH